MNIFPWNLKPKKWRASLWVITIVKQKGLFFDQKTKKQNTKGVIHGIKNLIGGWFYKFIE